VDEAKEGPSSVGVDKEDVDVDVDSNDAGKRNHK
jgi:hypothetical protein